MTKRERQLLNWIEENPLISQKDLAEKAGITRSSVAVHISNLMKKGYIAGKGYIVQNAPYVVVAGGVNVDIGGQPVKGTPLVPHDSNPGAVETSLGGVGRNIAHNMALLGMDVPAFGDDISAQKIAANCGELGIDISQSLVVPDGRTSTYLFINDEDGDMALAVSDMEIYSHITPQVLAQRQRFFNNSQVIVLDTNLPAESIAWLAENCTSAPIFADPVSTAKAEKLRPVLGKIHTLKPNRLEAELLSGVSITGEASLREAAEVLLSTGLRRVFISLGAGGVYAAGQDGSVCRLPAAPVKAVNTTGCGDAFMAAITWAYLQGTDLEETVRAGLAAAAIAMGSVGTINPAMSEDALREKLREQAYHSEY